MYIKYMGLLMDDSILNILSNHHIAYLPFFQLEQVFGRYRILLRKLQLLFIYIFS